MHQKILILQRISFHPYRKSAKILLKIRQFRGDRPRPPEHRGRPHKAEVRGSSTQVREDVK